MTEPDLVGLFVASLESLGLDFISPGGVASSEDCESSTIGFPMVWWTPGV